MATPYLTYQEGEAPAQASADSRVAAARVAADASEYRSLVTAYNNIAREKSRYNITAVKEGVAARRNYLNAQGKLTDSYNKALAALQDVRIDNYQAQTRLAAAQFKTIAETTRAMVQAMYAPPPGIRAKLQKAGLTSPTALRDELVNSVSNQGEGDGKFYSPGTVTAALQIAIGPEAGLHMPDAEIAAGLSANGFSADVHKSMMALVQEARTNASTGAVAISQTQEAYRKANSVLGKGYQNDAELKADIADLQQELTRTRGQVDVTMTATPEMVRAALVEDEATLSAYNKLSEREDELYELAFGEKKPSDPGVLLGKLLDDEGFQMWARDNDLSDIGFAQKDEQGNIVGASPGRDLAMAFHRFNFQRNNPAKWGQTFKRKGGQFSDDFVEVRYIPPEAPVAGRDKDGRDLLKMGDRLFDVSGGSLREINIDAAKGVTQWDLAYTGSEGAPEALTPEMIASGQVELLILDKEDPQALKDKVFDLSARTEKGWREKPHAALIDKYGPRGYAAIARESDGERIEFDGALPIKVNVISTGMDSRTERSNARGALRQRLKGGTEEQLLGDTKPMYRFGNVQYNRGEAKPDPATNALKDRVIGSNEKIPDLSLDVPEIPPPTKVLPEQIRAEIRAKVGASNPPDLDPETPPLDAAKNYVEPDVPAAPLPPIELEETTFSASSRPPPEPDIEEMTVDEMKEAAGVTASPPMPVDATGKAKKPLAAPAGGFKDSLPGSPNEWKAKAEDDAADQENVAAQRKRLTDKIAATLARKAAKRELSGGAI